MFKCSNKTCRSPVEKRGYCQPCSTEIQRAWRESHPGYAAQKWKEWADRNRKKLRAKEREKYRLKREALGKVVGERPPALTMSERKKRYFEKHPIKAEARKIYKYALRMGKLERGPCAVCGTTENIDGHHTDYTKPLDVVWLCKEHHRQAHLEHRDKPL